MFDESLLMKIRQNERRGFANFVSKKTGVQAIDLVEWDYIIHTILKELEKDPYFRENYVFKGGTCLVKCHLGYYRFSRDLDFAYRKSDELKEMSRSKLRKLLNEETGMIAESVKCIARDLGLDFKYRDHNDFNNHRYFSFLLGPGWFRELILYSPLGEKIKIEVNYAEKLAFRPKSKKANTLLSWKKAKLSSQDYERYVEFLGNYYPVTVTAYSEKEILIEKVRAILTRRDFKLRDLYDLYKLYQGGLKIHRYHDEIAMKIENYLELSSAARENLENTLDAIRRGEFPKNIEKEIEQDVGLIVEDFSKEKFISFVNHLRFEVLDILESMSIDFKNSPR